jgi:tetratricopeptide (TPR) repeat protein
VTRLLVILLALGLLAPLPAPSSAQTREQAVAGLADVTHEANRRRAVVWFGENGTMDDVPRLVGALRELDALVRGLAERGLWEIWSRSGDEEVDQLLQLGVGQMQAREGDAAVRTFTRVIERRPDFAEGWNKRATVYYLLGEYRKSLADCDEVMKRNPHHFGALSGYGMIYVQLDQPARALEYFERALGVNPNLEQVREAADGLRRALLQRRKNTL